jgi:archaemetzincin
MSLKDRILLITKIGEVDAEVLSYLRTELMKHLKTFNLLVQINPNNLKIKTSEFNSRRNKYDGSQILNRIRNSLDKRNYFRNLGVIDVDLFASDLNFIFGLAMKPQKMLVGSPAVALISIIRLREFYDEPLNKERFFIRILKEALHELGHTFGLDHCQNFCVMRFSNVLSETDEKPPNYCTICYRQISEVFSRAK